MTPSTNTELLEALSANFQEIAQSTERISGGNNDDERRRALSKIIELRKARRKLEAKLRALKNNSQSAH